MELMNILQKIADEIVDEDGNEASPEQVASALLNTAFGVECSKRGITSDDVYLDNVIIDPRLGIVGDVIAPSSLRKEADDAHTFARIRVGEALNTLAK